jgi:hypothetical protein
MDYEDALWAERTMYDAVAMSVANGVGDLPGKAQPDIEGERSAALPQEVIQADLVGLPPE